jgi:fibro-slime domain-containing protein
MHTESVARRRHAGLLLLIAGWSVAGASMAHGAAQDRLFVDGFDIAPVARFDANPIGFTVNFTDQASDAFGPIGTWSWDFGDGTTSTDQNPVHAFAAAGTYRVTETVTDLGTGAADALAKLVTVVPCGTLTTYLHDFRAKGEVGGHPDFEAFSFIGVTFGLASSTITPGGVPTLNFTGPPGQPQVTSAASFAQWFVDNPINLPIRKTLVQTEGPAGTYTYSNLLYFPIDGEGYGNYLGFPNNYHFTTVLRAQFQFQVGQTLSVSSADDAWVYVNGHLVIDLGGLHAREPSSITLDAAAAAQLGLSAGQIYPLDLFQAQRHTALSQFILTSTMCLGDSH